MIGRRKYDKVFPWLIVVAFMINLIILTIDCYYLSKFVIMVNRLDSAIESLKNNGIKVKGDAGV